jgi:hypothetical protein
VSDRRISDLAGVSHPRVSVRREGSNTAQQGPLLITHRGFSGPAILRLSAWEARAMAEIFVAKYAEPLAVKEEPKSPYPMAAEDPVPYRFTRYLDRSVRTHALILHDEGTKEERKQRVEDFKEGKIDILFVYNMLLTGFDAPRLKKLYLGREIKSHNLLQALTRVNRTYGKHRFGYVVDFVDIRRQFDLTNQAYLRELNDELGDEAELVSFELARDNTRLLLLVQTATGVRVLLTAVERDDECLPQSLGDFVELGPLTGNAVDAAWVDDSSVAVVVEDPQTDAGEVFVFDTNGR